MLSVRLQGVKRRKNSTINNAKSGSGREVVAYERFQL